MVGVVVDVAAAAAEDDDDDDDDPICEAVAGSNTAVPCACSRQVSVEGKFAPSDVDV